MNNCRAQMGQTLRRSARLVRPKKEVTSKYFQHADAETKIKTEQEVKSRDGEQATTKVKLESEGVELDILLSQVKLESDIDVATPKTKKEPVLKRRKVIKRQEIEVESSFQIPAPSKPAPKNFEKIWEEVKLMRLKIVTPVDTLGCAFLPEKVSGLRDGPVYRYQLLVCLMLSSQTKDEVNAVAMRNLQDTMLGKGFVQGLCIDAILATPELELDKLIFKVGFHSRKLKYIKQTTEILRLKYNDDIPKTIEEITSFPGVGPKMGYLLLQAAWDITTGIGVDVHIFRLANMWGWVPKTKHPTPEHTRLELEKWLPHELWKEFNPVMVGFGQSICPPRGRRCDLCTLPNYGRLCANVDRALVNGRGLKSPRKVRGDLSLIMKERDIEDLV